MNRFYTLLAFLMVGVLAACEMSTGEPVDSTVEFTEPVDQQTAVCAIASWQFAYQEIEARLEGVETDTTNPFHDATGAELADLLALSYAIPRSDLVAILAATAEHHDTIHTFIALDKDDETGTYTPDTYLGARIAGRYDYYDFATPCPVFCPIPDSNICKKKDDIVLVQ
ncbi:hypothetical protein [Pontibacter sp. G13]|uniref:hypothetical protein n=1 Tax=Pontibacter sp. G13 TaxID=3074898 RepID=UPI00288AE627|nr:hypothetical protein [Pontibacter sp. G13]WNJ17090.1 hypothetical protein RJD25_19725 [Pontibacter sp. G13]